MKAEKRSRKIPKPRGATEKLASSHFSFLFLLVFLPSFLSPFLLLPPPFSGRLGRAETVCAEICYDLDGLNILVAAAATASDRLKSYILGGLWNISLFEQFRRLVVERGGLDLVISTLQGNLHSSCYDMYSYGAGLIRALATIRKCHSFS